eukprot:758413-Hanusia_phi.AAC.1
MIIAATVIRYHSSHGGPSLSLGRSIQYDSARDHGRASDTVQPGPTGMSVTGRVARSLCLRGRRTRESSNRELFAASSTAGVKALGSTQSCTELSVRRREGSDKFKVQAAAGERHLRRQFFKTTPLFPRKCYDGRREGKA